jgi:hypothetical protein
MKTIQNKIAELLKVSAVEADYTKGFDALGEKMDKQELLMEELEELAKAQKTILGRTIRFPHADSYALYIITKINKNKVQLDWINWCDAWVDDRCGYRSDIDLAYATSNVRGQDAMNELFGNSKKEMV